MYLAYVASKGDGPYVLVGLWAQKLVISLCVCAVSAALNGCLFLFAFVLGVYMYTVSQLS